MKKRTSYAFLMEMLWVCGFFILASCIFVLAFVKADRLSRHASDLNRAVLAVENAVEETFSGYSAPLADGTADTAVFYYGKNWERVEAAEDASYVVLLSSVWEQGLLTVDAAAAEFSTAKFSAGEFNAGEFNAGEFNAGEFNAGDYRSAADSPDGRTSLYSLQSARFYPDGR